MFEEVQKQQEQHDSIRIIVDEVIEHKDQLLEDSKYAAKHRDELKDDIDGLRLGEHRIRAFFSFLFIRDTHISY